MSPCQVVWIIHEARSRIINPFVTQLRALGYHSDVHYLEQSRHEFLQNFDTETHTLVVFYSYEDFLYAKNVWSWETQENKPSTRVTSLDDVMAYQLDHTSFCCIHDYDNAEKIDLHENFLNSLHPLSVVRDEAGVVKHVIKHFPQHSEQQEQQSEEPQVSRSVAPLPLVPLAARVVIIRHAQRLDEVHPTWSSLASRPQDSPLSAKGIQQARCLGQWLAKQAWANGADGSAVWFVSPFVRTVQTAHFALEEIERHEQEHKQEHKRQKTEQVKEQEQGGRAAVRMQIEYGLAEGAPWMAHAANSLGLCQTPWHLTAADLCGVSDKIDLDYESQKHPQFKEGGTYPGRPVEVDAWYDRCAQAVWRLARLPRHAGRTLVLMTHGGCVDNFVHALSGQHMNEMPTHTCVTSLLRDQHQEGGRGGTGCYHLEQVDRRALEGAYKRSSSSGQGAHAEELAEIRLSQHHLPPELRTTTVV